jgi:hypothetical protein
MTHPDIKHSRAMGRNNARAMVKAVSHEAACHHFRANSCVDTLHAFGYWDGFLTHLAETMPSPPPARKLLELI